MPRRPLLTLLGAATTLLLGPACQFQSSSPPEEKPGPERVTVVRERAVAARSESKQAERQADQAEQQEDRASRLLEAALAAAREAQARAERERTEEARADAARAREDAEAAQEAAEKARRDAETARAEAAASQREVEEATRARRQAEEDARQAQVKARAQAEQDAQARRQAEEDARQAQVKAQAQGQQDAQRTASGGAAASAQASGPEQRVAGEVVSAGGDSVTVRSPSGEPVQLKVEVHTTVVLDGQPASARDIPDGSQVRATWRDVEGEPTAVRVTATAPKDEATGGSGTAGQQAAHEQRPGATEEEAVEPTR